MAGCTDSTLCHLQWYPVPTAEHLSTWTPKDTLTIDLPIKLQDIQKTQSCAWHIEAAGNAGYAYTHLGVHVGLATQDTIYWQEVLLHPDSSKLSELRKETFGRTVWRQQGNLLPKTKIGSYPKDSLRRIIVLPLADTQHINDIGLCVQRLSARK